jgi:CheY-like chemotaxis protein
VATRAVERGVEIEIRDTGVGMTESTLQRCFEPFFSTKGALATGIGLAVAYGVVRAHGGHVDVHSRTGQGTTVRVTLPPHAAAPAQAAGPPPGAAGTVPARALRILVIDDDPAILSLLSEHFTTRRHAVSAVGSGHEGLDRAAREPFDLIITDRAMPDMSGDDVALRIRQRDPAVAILMLTGFGDLMRDTDTHPSGVNGVVGKPVALDELDRIVAGVVA